jgi:hypothetical protein
MNLDEFIILKLLEMSRVIKSRCSENDISELAGTALSIFSAEVKTIITNTMSDIKAAMRNAEANQ